MLLKYKKGVIKDFLQKVLWILIFIILLIGVYFLTKKLGI